MGGLIARMTPVIDFTSAGYDTDKVIGQGQFGSVFLLRRSGSNKDLFVCKLVLLDALCESDRNLAEQEVELLRSLDHRNIVKFHDCVSTVSGSAMGLIMQYCDGGDLRHVIREQAVGGRYFPESVIMTWLTQVASGLRYIHSKKIIHRDLKTSNIFLKGPPPFECLIGDFGISRVLESTLGTAHTVIGTPYYLSPEVCKKEPYSFESDMWSLGACLYEMAMLRTAFQSSNLLTLVNKIIYEEFEPIDPLGFSFNFRFLVSNLLEKDPQKRPSASQVLRHEYVIRYYSEDNTCMTPLAVSLPPRAPTLRLKRPPSRSIGSCGVSPEKLDGRPPEQSSIARGLLPGKLEDQSSISKPVPPPRIR